LFRPIESSVAPDGGWVWVTVKSACLVAFRLAVIVVVPADTAATVNEPVDDPAAIVTLAATVATAGLLLFRPTVAPPVEAATVSVIVP
jgi:hypothetical protein